MIFADQHDFENCKGISCNDYFSSGESDIADSELSSDEEDSTSLINLSLQISLVLQLRKWAFESKILPLN